MSSAANFATIITENNSSNIRVLANNISFQNWGGKQIASGASLATNLSASSNVTVMTIAGCNVGIGSTTPSAALDIIGNLNVSGSITRNGVAIATTNWQQLNTTTFLSAGNKLGIGTTNTQGYDIYVAGEISASNVYARNAFFIANDSQAVRNALQLSPVKSNYIVTSSTQSVFTLLQSGIYTGTASNTDVYLNGVKLVYRDASKKDYDLSYSWIGLSNTQYTITLVQPAVSGDIVDIAVWPTFYNTTSCNLPGYVYQTFGSYQWQNQGTSNTFIQGSVGIGTSIPTQSLDVRGNARIGSASSYSNYVQSGSNLLMPVSNGLINGVNIGALNERTRPSYAVALSTVSSWTARTSANENASWVSICWSPKLKMFVAVAFAGSGSRVMYSYNGSIWVIVNTGSLDSVAWNAVCWSQELGIFVVAGGNNTMMYSYDGINWSSTTVGTNSGVWYWVCWAPEISTFVAVMSSGTAANKVAYSTNGVNWTLAASTNDSAAWVSVCWSAELGIFVAVSQSATNRIMTSPNGINWTARPSAAADSALCFSICWSPELGMFVIVVNGGSTVLTSSDGIIWTSRPAVNGLWTSVCWSAELALFVAVSNGTNYIMTSPDGITWTSQKTASNNTVLCRGVCWSPELSIFVTVSGNTVSGKQIMTSAPGIPSALNTILSPSLTYQSGYDVMDSVNLVKNATLPPLPGIVGWYTGDSWTGTQLSDLSGAGNHATITMGTITKATIPNTTIPYIYGGTSAAIVFPAAILPTTYTIFHVIRYNGANQKRILTNPNGLIINSVNYTAATNWWSGHKDGATGGTAYHGATAADIVTPRTNILGTNWVISTDLNNTYRSQGTDRTNVVTTQGLNVTPLSINGYGTEESDWAVAEIIVYNRTLGLIEIQTVESYLINKYAPVTTGFPSGYNYSSLLSTNVYGNRLLTVNPTGVGMGTTTPANTMDVLGSVAIGSGFAGTTAAPANSLIVSGNVGIGITTPTYKLEVNGPIRTTGVITRSFSRTVNNTNNNVYDIVRFGTGTAYEFEITIHGDQTGVQVSKSYILTTAYPGGNPFASGTSYLCYPISQVRNNNDADDIELVAVVTANTGVTFKLVHTAVNQAAPIFTINFVCKYPTNNTPVITDLTGNAPVVDATWSSYAVCPTTPITQRANNVGIGVTNPSYKLQVNGQIYGSQIISKTPTTGTAAFRVICDGTTAFENWWIAFNHAGATTDSTDRARIGISIAGSGAGQLWFTTGLGGAQTEKMKINETGVGIGSNVSASYPLDVSGIIRGSSRLIIGNAADVSTYLVNATDSNVAVNTSRFIVFGKGQSPNNQVEIQYMHAAENASSNYGSLGLYGTASLYWTGSGFVGVGVTNPPSPLSLLSSGGSGGIYIEPGKTSDGTNAGFHAINFNGYNNGSEKRVNTNKNRWRITVDQRSTTDVFSIDTYNGTGTGTVALSIDKAGNIGIGLTNPSTAMHVNGTCTIYNAGTTGALILANGRTDGVNQNVQIKMGYPTGNSAWLYHYVQTRHDQFSNNTNANAIDFFVYNSNATYNGSKQVMSITGAGVGIGLNNPSYSLDVTGTCRISSNVGIGTIVSLNSFGNTPIDFFSTNSSTTIMRCQDWGNSMTGISTTTESILYVGSRTSTSRSINARGTVNVNGADYAEYMKKEENFTIQKGDVCGITCSGLLTNMYSRSIMFVVKSTRPCIVGGDEWSESFEEKPQRKNYYSDEDYDHALAGWTERFEALRNTVDRISFTGKVPVNFCDCNPGQYLYAIEGVNDTITFASIDPSNITFAIYPFIIGRVINKLEDGRAEIIIKNP